MEPDVWEQHPDGWHPPTAQQLEVARTATLHALAPPGWPALLDYYDRTTAAPGATFADLFPNDPADLTATDLVAAGMLAPPPGAGATRRLLEPNRVRQAVLEALSRVAPTDLLVAGPAQLEAMEDLYVAVLSASVDPVTATVDDHSTASAVCARLRPELYPTFEPAVWHPWAMGDRGAFRTRWLTARVLVGDRAVIDTGAAFAAVARQAARTRAVRVDALLLRLIDVALRVRARQLESVSDPGATVKDQPPGLGGGGRQCVFGCTGDVRRSAGRASSWSPAGTGSSWTSASR